MDEEEGVAVGTNVLIDEADVEVPVSMGTVEVVMLENPLLRSMLAVIASRLSFFAGLAYDAQKKHTKIVKANKN